MKDNSKTTVYFLTVVEDSTKTTRTLWICVPISMVLVLVLNGYFLQQAIANLLVMLLVEQLKWHLAKGSLQRSLNNQLLDYKAILDLCDNKMMSTRFFGICKESMISVENIETEKWYERREIVPVTWSSHYLVPLSFLQTCTKLTSKDESYVNIQSISLFDLCMQLILVGWHG